MMTGVTDNEPPTPPHGLNMDAEEYRRFQEFQRFQDYQRFVEAQRQGANLPVPVQPGQPVPHHQVPQQPPLPPHQQQHAIHTQLEGMRQQLARIERVTNPPVWKKILHSKWLHRLVGLLIIAIIAVWGVPTLINHYFGGNDNPGGPAALHPGTIQGSGRLEKHPRDAVAAVYHIIATTPPDTACLEFTSAAAAQFARDMHAADCTQAVRTIHDGLDANGVNGYSFVVIPASAMIQQGNTVQISSCAMQLDGGPRLGLFVVTENQYQEWQITGHRNEPNPCPAPSSTTVPPTS
jgi:hypothetical protein